MDNGKRQSNEEHQRQPIPQQPINFNEYAGDADDDKLAREQANQYIEDINRSMQEPNTPDNSKQSNQ